MRGVAHVYYKEGSSSIIFQCGTRWDPQHSSCDHVTLTIKSKYQYMVVTYLFLSWDLQSFFTNLFDLLLALDFFCNTVRTGLEGPGLTVAQKIWYCVATVGGQYIWTRLQSFSAFRRWGDSEQVLVFRNSPPYHVEKLLVIPCMVVG